MSTMPPAPPPQGMSTFAKWLIGCTVGCFLLILVSCGGFFALTYWVSRSAMGKIEQMQAAAATARARADEIAKLDEAHAPRLPEDVAFAEVTNDEIDRYLRVRRELAPNLQALVDSLRGIPLANPTTLGDNPSFKEVFGAVKGTMDGLAQTQAAHQALLDAAAVILAREQIGPTDLARMAEIVEWRYLQRPEAVALGLPAFRRREIIKLQVKSGVLEAMLATPDGVRGLDPNDRARSERELADARERLTEVAAESARNVTLIDATRAALDARRAELEALSAAGITAIAPLSADSPWLDSIHAGGPMGAHGQWKWSTSGHEPDRSAPASDGSAPEPAEPEGGAATGPAGAEPTAPEGAEPAGP